MNAFVSISADADRAAAATARSAMLDAFADAEAAVHRFLLRHKVSFTDAMQTSQLIALAKKVPVSCTLSNAHHALVGGALSELMASLQVRADVVHGKMHVVDLGSERRLLFINPRQASENAPLVRLISFGSIDQLTNKIAAIARKIT